jgi:hypothetical protein
MHQFNIPIQCNSFCFVPRILFLSGLIGLPYHRSFNSSLAAVSPVSSKRKVPNTVVSLFPPAEEKLQMDLTNERSAEVCFSVCVSLASQCAPHNAIQLISMVGCIPGCCKSILAFGSIPLGFAAEPAAPPGLTPATPPAL